MAHVSKMKESLKLGLNDNDTTHLLPTSHDINQHTQLSTKCNRNNPQNVSNALYSPIVKRPKENVKADNASSGVEESVNIEDVQKHTSRTSDDFTHQDEDFTQGHTMLWVCTGLCTHCLHLDQLLH